MPRCPYNAIIRCPTPNNLKLVISTYHLKMKFPKENGVGVVRGEQVVARECYVHELRVKETSEIKPVHEGT